MRPTQNPTCTLVESRQDSSPQSISQTLSAHTHRDPNRKHRGFKASVTPRRAPRTSRFGRRRYRSESRQGPHAGVKRYQRHVFHLASQDQTPRLAMEVPCVYGAKDCAFTEYLYTCTEHRHDCLPDDHGSHFGRRGDQIQTHPQHTHADLESFYRQPRRPPRITN